MIYIYVEFLYNLFRIDLEHLVENTCLKVPQNVESIVGTFVNGTLEGPAKITMKNDTLNGTAPYFGLARSVNLLSEVKYEIANFKNGTKNGLSRTWNKFGKLNHISYKIPYIMSYTWAKVGNFLVYSNEAFLVTPFAKTEPDFLMDLKAEQSYIGRYQKHFDVFSIEYEVELTENMDTNQCILKPNWTKKSAKVEIISLRDGQTVKSNLKSTCENQKSIDNGEYLEFWKNSLNDSPYGHLTIWKIISGSYPNEYNCRDTTKGE